MYNKTLLDKVIEAKDDAVAIVSPRMIEIIATVVFLFGISGGRKRWLNLLHILAFLFGLSDILAPQTARDFYFEGTADAAHIKLSLISSVLLLCWVIGYWLLSKSSDSTTETSILTAYTVCMGTVVLALAYSMGHPSKRSSFKFIEDMNVKVFYQDLLVFVGSLFFYLSAKDLGGYGEVTSHANFHLRLEFVLLLVMGVAMYALPQWTIRLVTSVDKIDSIHALYARTCGAILIGMAFLSGRAANFLRQGDKDAVVLSHLMFYLYLVGSSCYAAFFSWATLSWKYVAVTAFFEFVLVINAIGALNIDRSVVGRVIVPRIKAIPEDIKSCFQWKTV